MAVVTGSVSSGGGLKPYNKSDFSGNNWEIYQANQRGGTGQNAVAPATTLSTNRIAPMNTAAPQYLSGAAQTGTGYATRVLDTAFDPQNALYNRTAQQLQDQIRAGQASRGITQSPYGANLESQGMSNFNIDWQNQQLGRQAQGLGAYATGMGPGLSLYGQETGFGLQQRGQDIGQRGQDIQMQQFQQDLAERVRQGQISAQQAQQELAMRQQAMQIQQGQFNADMAFRQQQAAQQAQFQQPLSYGNMFSPSTGGGFVQQPMQQSMAPPMQGPALMGQTPGSYVQTPQPYTYAQNGGYGGGPVQGPAIQGQTPGSYAPKSADPWQNLLAEISTW